MSRYVIEPRKHRHGGKCFVIVDKLEREVLGRYATRDKAKRVLVALECHYDGMAEREPEPSKAQHQIRCHWCGR